MRRDLLFALFWICIGGLMYEAVSRERWVFCVMVGHEDTVQKVASELDPESTGDAAAVAAAEEGDP